MSIDYRCRGDGCPVNNNCTRANLGKRSVAPYAAFDMRRQADDYCPQYLPIRITETAENAEVRGRPHHNDTKE